MEVGRRTLAVLVVCGTFATGAAAPESPQVITTAVEQSIAIAGERAHATFRVQVENADQSPLTNVWVVFEDGSSVAVGDIAPGKSAASGVVEQSLTLPEEPSRNFPVYLTLKFLLDGAEVQVRSAVSLSLS